MPMPKLNGFESTCPVRGNLLLTSPGRRIQMTFQSIGNGASSTTSKCILLLTTPPASHWNPVRNQSPMTPFTHGIIGTGTPEGINGSGVLTRTLRAHPSLRHHRTSCTRVCPHRRLHRAPTMSDVCHRFPMIFYRMRASDLDTSVA